MNIRKATTQDTDAVTQIYDHIHDCEETGTMTIGWQRGIYPVRATAETAVSLGDLFVLEDGGNILAAGRINQQQLPEYADAEWLYKAADDEVWVLHTLVVEPSANGRGYARAFLEFYENYALERGCHVLRIDTNERNSAARAMYAKHGWREAGIVPCTFNVLPGVHLVCLEKKI